MVVEERLNEAQTLCFDIQQTHISTIFGMDTPFSGYYVVGKGEQVPIEVPSSVAGLDFGDQTGFLELTPLFSGPIRIKFIRFPNTCKVRYISNLCPDNFILGAKFPEFSPNNLICIWYTPSSYTVKSSRKFLTTIFGKAQVCNSTDCANLPQNLDYPVSDNDVILQISPPDISYIDTYSLNFLAQTPDHLYRHSSVLWNNKFSEIPTTDLFSGVLRNPLPRPTPTPQADPSKTPSAKRTKPSTDFFGQGTILVLMGILSVIVVIVLTVTFFSGKDPENGSNEDEGKPLLRDSPIASAGIAGKPVLSRDFNQNAVPLIAGAAKLMNPGTNVGQPAAYSNYYYAQPINPLYQQPVYPGIYFANAPVVGNDGEQQMPVSNL